MKVAMLAAVAAVGMLSLVACSKGGGANTAAAGGAGGPPGAPAAGADTAITEAELPHLKAGYWEVTETEPDGRKSSIHFCNSGQPPNFKAMAKNCSQFSFRRTMTGGIAMDATCGEKGYSNKMHMTAEGDFNSSYTGDSEMTMTIPGRAPMTVKTHTENRWVGPCPAGEAADTAGTD